VPADLAMVWPPQAWFADALHGYLALYDCDGVPPVPTPPPAGPPPGKCPVYLAATADGGRTWQPRAVPGATVPELASLVNRLVYGLDADHLVMEAFTGDAQVFTADGGRTWHVLALPVDVVDEVPPGAILTVRGNVDARVFTVIRPDGTTARLNHLPGLGDNEVFLGGAAAFTADGALWVKVGGVNIDQFAFVSRDRGRTWSRVKGPAGAGVVYATTGPAVFAVDYAHTRIWRSTDDSDHWTQVPLPFSATTPLELWIEARADGSLLAGDPVRRKVYQVAPGSSTAVQVPVDAHMFAWHLGTSCFKTLLAGAPFTLDTPDTRSYDFAPDCVHWGPLPFPANPK
jgi:hypothetical protein